MPHRIRAMGLRPFVAAAWRGVSSEIGRAEVLIVVGVVLVTVGLWPHLSRGALVVPGLVCLWLALAPVPVSPRKG